MQRLFETMTLGNVTLSNRFIFPPIKTAYGTPAGAVTDGHLAYYGQIAQNGPGLLIIEPVKEQIHLPESADELSKLIRFKTRKHESFQVIMVLLAHNITESTWRKNSCSSKLYSRKRSPYKGLK
jgi:2,4-dienoyl-CoA reductase-like NADH-dependent reductase (Old Yellow Enzyme family)